MTPRVAIGALLVGILLCLGRASSGNQAQAEVKGAVTDTAGAGIAGASLAFTCKGRTVTVKTDSSGTYRVLLEPGIYQVSVKAFAFHQMRRAGFTLHEGDEVNFNFQLLTAVISDPVFRDGDVHSQAQNLVDHDPFNYQEDSLKAIRDGLQPLVLYGHHEKRPDSVTYTGMVRDGKPQPVVYTYDLLTVKSQELTYFWKDGSIEGTGSVVLEDGKNIERGSKIKISFIDGRPQIKLE